MPLVRYFLLIGGVLLAFLFISDFYFPKEAVVNNAVADANRAAPALRIRSDQKWPEKIVLDTTLPTVTASQVEIPPVTAVAPKAVADIDTTTAPLEAFAQVRPSESIKHPTKKRRVARLPRQPAMSRQPAMASTQQSGIDFFAWR